MRVLILIFLSIVSLVAGKSNVKMLTESMGQEVIEIGTPLKDLPMGLDEEPSPDNDDEDKITSKTISNSVATTTKREMRKTTTLASIKKLGRDNEKIDGLNQEDDDARIEKELAEIYKDNADYKTDSGEETEKPSENTKEQVTEDETTTEVTDKPIARQKQYYRLEPDSTDKASVEKFRTTIDIIDCRRHQALATQVPVTQTLNAAFDIVNNKIILIISILSYFYISI